MKRYLIVVLLALAMVCSLSACSNNAVTNGGDEPTGNNDNLEGEVYHGKIVAVDGDMVMLVNADAAANSADILRNSLAGLALTDSESNPMELAALAPGMLVDIAFSGQIMETYPAQLDNPTAVKVVGQEADLVGFYLGVLNDLYDIDPGLNRF